MFLLKFEAQGFRFIKKKKKNHKLFINQDNAVSQNSKLCRHFQIRHHSVINQQNTISAAEKFVHLQKHISPVLPLCA